MKGNETISGLAQELAYMTGCSLRGITLTRKDEGWLMTVKILDRRMQPKVSFLFAHTPEDCFDQLWAALRSTAINLTWREDRWA